MNAAQTVITIVAVLALGAAAVAVLALRGEDAQPAPVASAPTVTQTAAASPPAAPTQATAEATATVPPDRDDCEAIRGTAYRSESERAFFLASCTSAPSAPTAASIDLPVAAAESCETRVEVSSSRDDATYDVAGETLEEIAASLDANAPQTEVGTAYGLTEYSYGIEGLFCLDAAGACSLGEIAVSADVVVTLPRLTTQAQLSGELATTWNDYYDLVSVHEGRHVRILEEGLEEIQRLLLLIKPQPDCDVLQHEIDKAWALGSGQIEQRQRSFHVADELGSGGLVVQ